MMNETLSLSGVAQQSAHWTKIVRTLAKLEATGTLDPENRTWARVVSELTGQSLNQLRKMQRTLSTLESLLIKKSKSFDLDNLLMTVPFSHAEVLARIVKADEQRGLQLIDKCSVQTNLPTYRDLLAEFYKVRDQSPNASSVATGQRAARRFEETCLEMLVCSKARILHDSFLNVDAMIFRWSGGLSFASPDIVAGFRSPAGELIVDGIDCLSANEVSQDDTAKRMARTATECTFFRHFWMLIAPWSPASLILSMRDELRLANLGVVRIDPEKKLVLDIALPTGTPVPNRQPDAAATFKWLFRKL